MTGRSPECVHSYCDGSVDISLGMQHGYRTLLGRWGKEIDAAVDHRPAESPVQLVIVIGCQIMPVDRLMAHEINHERRTLACYQSCHTSFAQLLFEAPLYLGAEV